MTVQVRYPAHIRQLKASLNGTRKWQLAHRKMCYQCRIAHVNGRPDQCCDYGWEVAKDASRFARALERAGHPELIMDGDQLALF